MMRKVWPGDMTSASKKFQETSNDNVTRGGKQKDLIGL
jgi:hypothetical protein